MLKNAESSNKDNSNGNRNKRPAELMPDHVIKTIVVLVMGVLLLLMIIAATVQKGFSWVYIPVFLFSCVCVARGVTECGAIIKRISGKKKAYAAGGSLRGDNIDNANRAYRAQSEAAKEVRTGNGHHDEVLPRKAAAKAARTGNGNHDGVLLRKAAAKEARTGNEKHDEVLPKKEVTAQDSTVKEERTDNAAAEAARPENDGVEATARPEKVEAETAVYFDDFDLEAIPAIDRGMRHDQWTVYTEEIHGANSVYAGECRISESLLMKVYVDCCLYRTQSEDECKKCRSGVGTAEIDIRSGQCCCRAYYLKQDRTGVQYYRIGHYKPFEMRELLEGVQFDITGRDNIVSRMNFIFQSPDEKLDLSHLKTELHRDPWVINEERESFIREKSEEFDLSVETMRHLAELLSYIGIIGARIDHGITVRSDWVYEHEGCPNGDSLFKVDDQIRYVYAFSESSPTWHTGSVTEFCDYIAIEKVSLKWEDIKGKCADVPYTASRLRWDSQFAPDCEIAVQGEDLFNKAGEYSDIVYLREPFGGKDNYMIWTGSCIVR